MVEKWFDFMCYPWGEVVGKKNCNGVSLTRPAFHIDTTAHGLQKFFYNRISWEIRVKAYDNKSNECAKKRKEKSRPNPLKIARF